MNFIYYLTIGGLHLTIIPLNIIFIAIFCEVSLNQLDTVLYMYINIYKVTFQTNIEER